MGPARQGGDPGGFKWGLTRDDPMVAPNDGEKWSALARENSFGRKPPVAAVPIPAPRKTAGRPRKARPTETEAPALCTIAPLAPTPTMGAWRAKQEDARREQSLAGQTGRSKPTAYHKNRRAELLAQIGNNTAGDAARAASKRGLTLMQLRPTSCRWPMGDPASETFLFCGDPKDGASVYCACHRARAYTPIIRKVRTVTGVGA